MKRLSSLTLVVSIALIAVGCGRSSGGTSATTEAPPTTQGAAAGDFGTLKAVCGPGSAKGATDKGVTDTTITVATMSDPGNTIVPGLDQEFFDSADAFVGWCNAQGGILGRKLLLHKRDSALFNVSAQMLQSCQANDFSLVGNGEGLDATGVQQRLSCGLPEISSYDVSNQAGTAALSIQPLPTPVDESAMGGALKALAAADSQAIAHYGLVSSTTQSIKDSGNKDKAAAVQLGYTNAYYQESPLSVDNWRPYAQNIQAHGVQVLGFQSQANYGAALFKSLSDIGYFPKYGLFNANWYDPTLIADAGTALNGFTGGVYVNVGIVPFELADHYPATKQYINVLQQYANGAKPKSLGINAFSAWLLFAGGVKSCGSNLTRQCLMTYAGSQTNWTAGGLHAPRTPGNAKAGGSPCFVLLKATPGGFVVDTAITKPNHDIFNCDPGNAFKLTNYTPSS